MLVYRHKTFCCYNSIMQKDVSKVHIIGAPGSGKTYLSKKLSKQLNALLLELDQIHWDNNADIYNTKAPEDERDAKLLKFTEQDSWVIEGIYYKWVDSSFESADAIIILNVPNYLRNFRIIKRFILSKVGIGQCNEMSIKDLKALITWGNSFTKNNLPAIMDKTEPYKSKRYIFNKADKVFKFITD